VHFGRNSFCVMNSLQRCWRDTVRMHIQPRSRRLAVAAPDANSFRQEIEMHNTFTSSRHSSMSVRIKTLNENVAVISETKEKTSSHG